MTTKTTAKSDEEARALNSLEQITYGADHPDADPAILQRKAQAIASFRGSRRDDGDPVDHLSDDEVWAQLVRPVRAVLRAIS